MQFNAPPREEIADLEEEEDLSIAIEESLQSPSTNDTLSFLRRIRDNLRDNLIGGFGS